MEKSSSVNPLALTDLNRLNEAQRTVGQGLSRTTIGLLAGVTLGGLALAVVRMIKMDRGVGVIVLTAGAAVGVGAATGLVLSKAKKVYSHKRYDHLCNQVGKEIGALRRQCEQAILANDFALAEQRIKELEARLTEVSGSKHPIESGEKVSVSELRKSLSGQKVNSLEAAHEKLVSVFGGQFVFASDIIDPLAAYQKALQALGVDTPESLALIKVCEGVIRLRDLRRELDNSPDFAKLLEIESAYKELVTQFPDLKSYFEPKSPVSEQIDSFIRSAESGIRDVERVLRSRANYFLNWGISQLSNAKSIDEGLSVLEVIARSYGLLESSDKKCSVKTNDMKYYNAVRKVGEGLLESESPDQIARAIELVKKAKGTLDAWGGTYKDSMACELNALQERLQQRLKKLSQ
jgi:hypothetical protein